MNNIKLKISGIFCALILLSCGADFLEQPPRGSLTVGTFPNTADDAMLAINGCYNILRQWQLSTGGFPLLDIMADDATKGSNPGDGTAIAPYENFTHDASEGSLERWYKTLYEAIRRTNLVIEEVPKINMNSALRDRIVGEARFMRGYFYSELVKGFGAVPKVIVINPPLDLERTDVQVILSEIIYPDLEYAAAVLPEKSQYDKTDLGRVTRGAAKAILARTKLFYGNYNDVLTLTSEIIDSKEYRLVSDYNKIFSVTNEHNEESVFEIGATFGGFDMGGNQYANTQGVRGSPNKGWGFCRPSYLSLISGFKERNDPRMQASIIFLNDVIDGELILGDSSTPDTTYNSSNQIIEIECYNKKVWVPGNDTRWTFAHNRRICRYSDILLMHAEALNEMNRTSEALPFINMVRARARGNNNTLPDITTTAKNVVQDIIMDERKYEFCLEGLRFFDLVRTNRAEKVLGPLGFKSGKNELFPIPQSEVDISQGKITQNPGYN